MAAAIIAAVAAIVVGFVPLLSQWLTPRAERQRVIQDVEILKQLDPSAEAARRLNALINAQIQSFEDKMSRRVRLARWAVILLSLAFIVTGASTLVGILSGTESRQALMAQLRNAGVYVGAALAIFGIGFALMSMIYGFRAVTIQRTARLTARKDAAERARQATEEADSASREAESFADRTEATVVEAVAAADKAVAALEQAASADKPEVTVHAEEAYAAASKAVEKAHEARAASAAATAEMLNAHWGAAAVEAAAQKAEEARLTGNATAAAAAAEDEKAGVAKAESAARAATAELNKAIAAWRAAFAPTSQAESAARNADHIVQMAAFKASFARTEDEAGFEGADGRGPDRSA